VYRTLILFLFLSGYASAHEWTPTYPELKYSHVPGILKADMFLFNVRSDVGYYEVSVWDEDWNKVSFAAEMRVFPMDYLDRKSVTIYIKESDRNKVTYICSESKIQSDGNSQSSISSRVCSKIKR